MPANIVGYSKLVRTINATAAGTTAVNGSAIDMSGWDGISFIAAFGTLTATQVTSLKAQGGAASNLSDAADLAGTSTGTMADGDSNKALALDVYRPRQRYIRVVVVRGTANAVVDGVVAILYRGRQLPLATQDTTMSLAPKVVYAPAPGTP